MQSNEVTDLLAATRDDLVRDVDAALAGFGLRRLTPAELELVARLVLPHLNAVAALATRYEQERHAPPEPPEPTHQGWVSEVTPPRRLSKRPKRDPG